MGGTVDLETVAIMTVEMPERSPVSVEKGNSQISSVSNNSDNPHQGLDAGALFVLKSKG